MQVPNASLTPGVLHYRYGGGEGVILCLYVDDILIFGSSLKVIEEVKKIYRVILR
jgi:hypothetical protein